MELLFFKWREFNLSDGFLKTGCAVSLSGRTIANIWISNPAFPFLLTS